MKPDQVRLVFTHYTLYILERYLQVKDQCLGEAKVAEMNVQRL